MTKTHILQCVYSLNRGGVETWLMHVLRNIDRTKYQFDFLLHSTNPGHYDEEARSLGSKLLYCVPPSKVFSYPDEFEKLLRRHGPYDVVHSHDATWNGQAMRVAAQASIPIRITHSHNDACRGRPPGILRSIAHAHSINRSRRHATHMLACSKLAAESYFGKDWQGNTRLRVLPYGLDFSSFRVASKGNVIREELGLPNDAYVLGHVGVFREQKNHSFLIEIFQEVREHNKNAHLLLVGHGPQELEIRSLVNKLGLASHVTFAGSRPDVPQIMLGAMDVFVFPSLYEGLGLVLLEAQAAALPCYYSDVIPSEVKVVDCLTHCLSLRNSYKEWAQAILNSADATPQINHNTALNSLEESDFSIQSSIAHLLEVYN